MAICNSEPPFMPSGQPRCLLPHNTLHWSLTVYFHNKISFEEPSGKGKKKNHNKYAQAGCLSNKSIFSVPCNTWKKCYIYTKSLFTSLYASQKDPREHLQRLQRITARHIRWCTVPKRCFRGGWRCRVFPCVYQTPQNICWSSRMLILVFQSG